MDKIDTGSIIVGLLIIIFIQVIIFIIIRELIMWYWKINKRIQLQEKTISLLQQILDQNVINKVSSNGNSNNSSERDEISKAENLSLNEMYKRNRENKPE